MSCRVKEKPYRELPDSEDRPDNEVADEVHVCINCIPCKCVPSFAPCTSLFPFLPPGLELPQGKKWLCCGWPLSWTGSAYWMCIPYHTVTFITTSRLIIYTLKMLSVERCVSKAVFRYHLSACLKWIFDPSPWKCTCTCVFHQNSVHLLLSPLPLHSSLFHIHLASSLSLPLQLKSAVQCKECGMKSVKFDPFTFLSLPLPVDSATNLEVIGETPSLSSTSLLYICILSFFFPPYWSFYFMNASYLSSSRLP